MKILKMKKMPKGRYKITFDNGSDLILYEDVIIKYILLTDKNIDEELLNQIIKDNYKSTAYNLGLQYIAIRMRSINEMRQYLNKKTGDEVAINEAISKLEAEGYLNDESFTRAFVNDKLNFSNDGKNKIRRSLEDYKVDSDIIDKVLLDVDDEQISDRVDKLIAKQIKLNTKYTGNILKQRILNYLINLGYDGYIIIEKLNNYNFKNNDNIEKEYQKLYKKYSNKYSGYKLEMTIKQKLFQKGYDTSQLEIFIK